MPIFTEDGVTGTADISVLIVAHNSRDTIPACLASLEAQTVKPREVWVLENGSSADRRLDAANLPDWVRFVDSAENLGFAGGSNHLAAQASGRWLALLNPDAFARPDWIEQLQAATQRYPDIALFGSTQYAAENPDLLDGAGDVYHAVGLAYRSAYHRPVSDLPPEGEVFGPCGAAAMIRADVFAELDGFDERFFCYNEDVDLAYRARLLGHRTIQLRDAAIDHMGYGSSGRRSAFATYYGARNRLWVFLRDTPGWLFWLLVPAHAGITLLLWLSAARFGQFGLFGKAIGDALKAWPELARSRRELQARAKVPPSAIASAMTWNPFALLTRQSDIRPWPRRD